LVFEQVEKPLKENRTLKKVQFLPSLSLVQLQLEEEEEEGDWNTEK
jgi:hypothetical protein